MADDSWMDRARRAIGESGVGGYLSESYDQFARGARSAREFMDSVTPGPATLASLLPGAGLVQGSEDFQRGRQALGEGRYGDAAKDYGLGFINAGTDMVPMLAALPPITAKGMSLPPIVRRGEPVPLPSDAPWGKKEQVRYGGVTTLKSGNPEHFPENDPHSMTPTIYTEVSKGDTPDQVLEHLMYGYEPHPGLPPRVASADAGHVSDFIEQNPVVMEMIAKRLREAQASGLAPSGAGDVSSDFWIGLQLQRNPRSAWARYLGPDASSENRAVVDRTAAEAKAASQARSEADDRKTDAYNAYISAGGTPSSPKAITEWQAANPGRQHTWFAYDDATGNWSMDPHFTRDLRTGEWRPVMAPEAAEGKGMSSGGYLEQDFADMERAGYHHAGVFPSSIPGRTDKLPVTVGSGAYILPADVVSALGEGNTMAGVKALEGVIGSHKPKFASGGGVKIIAAGGEYAIPPEIVKKIGNGDMDNGHNVLDQFVTGVRKKNINTLKGLPGPAK